MIVVETRNSKKDEFDFRNIHLCNVSLMKKIKMLKIFFSLVTMATKVGGVTRYEKSLLFLNYYSQFPGLHRDIYS